MDELSEILNNARIAPEWKAESIREAIENGADPNGDNGAAMKIAMRENMTDVVKVLRDAGADAGIAPEKEQGAKARGGGEKIGAAKLLDRAAEKIKQKTNGKNLARQNATGEREE